MKLFGIGSTIARLRGSKNLSLVFKGEIASGMGCYSDMTFPPKSGIKNAPDALPAEFHPGSLNINIASNGFPKGIRDIQDLDRGILKSSFTIAHDAIGNNMLRPTSNAPNRGTMHFWPATIQLDESRKIFDAWAARRIGSAYYNVVEVMSDIKLRDKHSLTDGMAVTLTLSAQP